jgi:ABC-type transport system substrate-binding protein
MSGTAPPVTSPVSLAVRRIGVAIAIALLVWSALVGGAPQLGGATTVDAARDPNVDLRISGVEPETWDPARSGDVETAATIAQVFEGLTTFDESAQVQPALAQTWQIEDEGRRIVFQLRSGLTFADGSPLDANDVVASWFRVLDPELPSPLWSLLADVRGAPEYVRGEGSRDDVGLRAEGDRVVVDFRRPAAYFPAAAGSPTLAVVPDDVGDRLGPGQLPAAALVSGAYDPESRTDTAVRLVANERYWAGKPALETVEIVGDVGDLSVVEAFEAGDLDYTTIGAADARWIRYDEQLGPALRRTADFSIGYYGFDTTQPPFDDARVRRAFAQAVDWDRLLRLSDSAAAPVTSIVPAGIADAGTDDFTPAYDPEAARRELADAGFEGGAGFPEVALVTGGFGFDAAIAEELKKELNVTVAVEHLTEGYFERLDTDPPQFWALSWIADYPHPQAFLGLLLETGSGSNYGGWSNAEYDVALERAAETADADQQEEAYIDAQRVVQSEVPVIPVVGGETWALSAEGLRGGIESGMGILRVAGMDWDR